MSVSKLNLFKKMRKEILPEYEILCIGDRGKWPGNDFELLDTNYSLSVDETSQNSSNCWNFLSPLIKGEKGIQKYFEQFDILNGFIQVKNNFM